MYNESIPSTISKSSRLLIKYILFPSINVSGECWYNGKLEAKAKEEYAFGIYWDQFLALNSLTSKEVSKLDEEVLSFFEICRSKDRKIIEKGQPERNPGLRRNQNNAMIEEMTTLLVQMGCIREHVEIALENVDQPEPEQVIDWIENNRERINEILFKKVQEKSLL